MRTNKGFTLIELLVSVTTFAILVGIVTLNLSTGQQKASIETVTDTLLADLSQQQLKAMTGDTEGRTAADSYGIHFSITDYALFHGTYNQAETSNFLIAIPEILEITTNFPSNEIIFERGSGEIENYNAATDEIQIENMQTGEQKTIELNRYGVVTGIN